MEGGDVKLLAQVYADAGDILSANTRVEGMKAENAYRESAGQEPMYLNAAFVEEAQCIEAIANRLRFS